MGPNMWLIPTVSEEMLVDQNSEFVLCLLSEYHTKSASQHHSGGAILRKSVHRRITTAPVSGNQPRPLLLPISISVREAESL